MVISVKLLVDPNNVFRKSDCCVRMRIPHTRDPPYGNAGTRALGPGLEPTSKVAKKLQKILGIEKAVLTR